jgi:hypothetical protein
LGECVGGFGAVGCGLAVAFGFVVVGSGVFACFGFGFASGLVAFGAALLGLGVVVCWLGYLCA